MPPAATSRSATGAQMRPWKPVGCASSTGAPSPPQSCTARVTPFASNVCEVGWSDTAEERTSSGARFRDPATWGDRRRHAVTGAIATTASTGSGP